MIEQIVTTHSAGLGTVGGTAWLDQPAQGMLQDGSSGGQATGLETLLR